MTHQKEVRQQFYVVTLISIYHCLRSIAKHPFSILLLGEF